MSLQARVFGPDSIITLTAKHDLAYCLHDIPEFEQAEALYIEVLEGWSRELGEDHLALAMPNHNLGALYSRWGRARKALPHATAAYEQRKATLGPDHPYTLLSQQSLATVLAQLDRSREAEVLRRQQVEQALVVHGEAAVMTQHARFDLGAFLAQGERWEEAQTVLLAAWELVPAMPESAGLPERIAEELMRLYEAQGAEEEAERWRQQLVEVRAVR